MWLDPADVADAGITKCSGPYATEADALADCPVNTFDPGCCLPSSVLYPQQLTVTLFGPSNSLVTTVNYDPSEGVPGSFSQWVSACLATPAWLRGTCALPTSQYMIVKVCLRCSPAQWGVGWTTGYNSGCVFTSEWNLGGQSGGDSCGFGAVPGGLCTPTRPINWTAGTATQQNSGLHPPCADHGSITSMTVVE